MHRHELATKFISKEQRGIEIAPWHDGLAPKRLGYRSLILDVFDTEQLRVNAAANAYIDPARVADIEPVDMVGSASDLERLVATRGELMSFDYVISSHNFEHVPDAVSFLKGCAAVLKPGGRVSMVVPDRRYTFDHFRPHTTTADVLEAFIEKRQRPSPLQQFLHHSLNCHYVVSGTSRPAFHAHDPIEHVVPFHALDESWMQRQAGSTEGYTDVHCWAFSPRALELVLRDLHWLKLIDLELVEITEIGTHEFFVHLVKPAAGRSQKTAEAFYTQRDALLRAVNLEAGSGGKQQQLLAAAQTELGRAQTTAAQLQERVTQLEGTLSQLTDEVSHLSNEVAVLRGSRSWRLTQPLRQAATVLRRLI